MNKAELLEENATLRLALYRPERSRFTQRRADLLKENREMRTELALYGRTLVRGEVAPLPEPKRQVMKRPLRASRRLRAITWPREKS